MLFILKNHPFYEQFNKQAKNNNLTNRYTKKYEIQLKKRYEKSKAFNPDNCYSDTENSQEDSLENLEFNSNLFNEKEKSLERSRRKSKSLDSYKLSSLSTKKNRIKEKISFYKNLIKVFDIFAVILILIGAVLSQYEQELYYFHNLIFRVPGVIIKDYIYRHHNNHSLSLIFDEVDLNLIELTNFKIDDYLEEFTEWKAKNEGEIFVNNYENFFILHKLNISRFAYYENVTDPSQIIIPLEISDYNNSLRVIILVTTLISIFLILCSRYVEHNREYFYKKESDLQFYKGEFFLLSILEIILILPIQYPKINSYIIFIQLGTTICLPYTSILSSISIFRFIFIYKIFKNITVWNSEYAEIKCEKYVCQADTRFAFKALQKENPFLTLGIIFVLTCVCFGFALRNFELHFWEARQEISQNWKYHWNALWCIFVSMTTVGYGDFYPKTHLGRMIIILACVVGIYFVSMTMVFMTGKSVLNESEMKAYKLIARLKLRKELKDLKAKIIYHTLNISKILNKIRNKIKTSTNGNSGSKQNDHERKLDVEYNYHKRCIFSLMEEKKKKERYLNNLEFVVIKEQLIDICGRIDTDIKEIKNQIDIMNYINNAVLEYSSSQADMLRYLRKNIFSLVSTYSEIEKNPKNFGVLANFDRSILQESEKIRVDFENIMQSGEILPSKDKIILEDVVGNNLNKISGKENPNICLDGNINDKIQNNSQYRYSLDDSSSSIENYETNKKCWKYNNPDYNINDISSPKFKEDRNFKSDGEPIIKFKNFNRSNGIKTNLFESKNTKSLLESELKCQKIKSDNKISLISNYLSKENVNSNFSKELSAYNLTADEIKAHFNYLFFDQSDNLDYTTKVNLKNNITNSKSNDSSKKDELKIKTMISMRRISSRKINLLKKN